MFYSGNSTPSVSVLVNFAFFIRCHVLSVSRDAGFGFVSLCVCRGKFVHRALIRQVHGYNRIGKMFLFTDRLAEMAAHPSAGVFVTSN